MPDIIENSADQGPAGMSWTFTQESWGTRLDAVDGRGWRIVACLGTRSQDQSHYLMPVRVVDPEGTAWEGPSEATVAQLVNQTLSLGRKLLAVDRLQLSTVKFAERFAPARLLLSIPPGADREAQWVFIRSVLPEIERMSGINLVTQIDYDQKRMHPHIGGMLDTIDFAIKHDPSAAATAISFFEILQMRGVQLEQSRWCVTGVGDLGGRIVRWLTAAGVEHVYVHDYSKERLAQATSSPIVTALSREETKLIPCHAHVMSADHSFADDLAEAWAKQKSVIAVGGPEAGLDGFESARRILGRAGKEFVPSVLCGSLGLVTNLEESLAIEPDLEELERRLRITVREIIGYSARHSIRFDVALELRLAGQTVPS